MTDRVAPPSTAAPPRTAGRRRMWVQSSGGPQPGCRGGLLLGAAGSTLVAIGGVGVGALPHRHGRVDDPLAAALGLTALHSTSGGRAFCTAAVALGVLTLLFAWWRLPRRSHAVLRAAALWSLPLLVAPPMFSRDAYAYAAQGALVAHGLDPFVVGPAALPGPLADSVAGQYAAAPAPYGPVFLAPAGRIVSLVGERLVPAVIGVRLFVVVGLLLLAWALPRLAQALGSDPGQALWLGLANPLVLLHGVVGLHNDALMAGLLVAGLASASSPGLLPLAAGTVLVTSGALVKAPALVALVFLPLLTSGSPRPTSGVPMGVSGDPVAGGLPARTVATRGAVVLAAAGLTASLATAVSGLSWGWLDTVAGGVAGPNLFSPVYGAGRAIAAATGADRQLVIHLVSRVGLALAAVVCLALLLRAHRTGPVRALGIALLAVVLLAPAVQPWYVLWGVPLLAATVGSRTRRALAAGCAVLCLLVLPNGRPLLQGPTWGLPVLLALAAAGVAARGAVTGPGGTSSVGTGLPDPRT